MVADVACSPGLKDGVLVCWGTLVVTLAPDKVPGGRDEDDGSKNDGGVIHRNGSDGKVGRHAEEGSRKSRPS